MVDLKIMPGESMPKRIFDVLFSFLGLIVLSPFLLVAALLIKLESRGPVFFRQIRIGKNFTPFTIYKLRTMVTNPWQENARLSYTQKDKITRVGRILRKTKIDELPQLINVLKGEMSFVGPRPELPEYVASYTPEQRQVLTVRPGITDIASVSYRYEDELFNRSPDPEGFYRETILPHKLALNLEYIEKMSFFYDLYLILRTLRSLFNSALTRGAKAQ